MSTLILFDFKPESDKIQPVFVVGVAIMRPLEPLFIVALVLYSFVIWSHKFKKKFSTRMVWLFGLGLLADTGGTIFLCVAVATRWIWNMHTIFGLAALLIMALHFVWAVLALNERGNWRVRFDRFSVYAWCVWMFAFLSGIPR